MDLHYNIFTSTDHEFRQKHYKNLTEHYYKILSESIVKLGSDPAKLYTFDNFQGDLKKFGRFAFIWGPMLIQMMLVDAKDIPDLEELSKDMANNEKHVDIIKGFNPETQIKYNKRINELLTDLVDYGYYWN